MIDNSSFDPSKPLDNARREAYVQAILDGKTSVTAYKQAFGTTQAVARVESKKISANAYVRARVAFLRGKLADDNLLTHQRKREILREIAEKARYDADKIRAIQEDNRMMGDVPDESAKMPNFIINVPPLNAVQH